MERMGLYDYKVIFISNILEKYDEAKDRKANPVGEKGFISLERDKKSKLFKNAKFEKYVIFISDIDNIIESMPSPYKDVIKKRYFQGDINTFMRDFNIKNKKEANSIIRKSVNIFFDAIERYRKAS